MPHRPRPWEKPEGRVETSASQQRTGNTGNSAGGGCNWLIGAVWLLHTTITGSHPQVRAGEAPTGAKPAAAPNHADRTCGPSTSTASG